MEDHFFKLSKQPADKQTSYIKQATKRRVIISPQTQEIMKKIVKFKIYQKLTHLLNDVAHTQNQSTDIAKALIEGIILLQRQSSNDEKKAVQTLFNQYNIDLIKQQRLFHNQLINQLKVNKKQISISSKSRIYHKIANQKNNTSIKQEEWQNYHQIKCIKDNNYKLLDQKEIQQVVKYEIIANSIKNMGQIIHFKYQSIKKESEKMIKLLRDYFAPNIAQINRLKYNLHVQQVLQIARFSRQACQFYDNGVFILLLYFAQSSKRLQQRQNKTSEQIDKLLNQAILTITVKYPPGDDLSKEPKQRQQALQTLQNPKSFEKSNFFHLPIPLNESNKQDQLEEIIIKHAQIAENCKQLFQNLVKETCLQKCVYFKINLKYYPNNPNPKAMTRIKQKILINKQKQSQFDLAGNLQAILKRQEENYLNIVDRQLEKLNQIKFNISDMVRGKCVFLEILDIIQTVERIKQFVKNNPKFKIKQIQNRFKNPIPISDVTMKIVIDDMIVAQLQLTIQVNAAAYSFAHKIYELQRSKVFSKIKIVHNYFEESNNEFCQLASKALSLINDEFTSKREIEEWNLQNIRSYFKLDKVQHKSFQAILSQVFQDKKQNNIDKQSIIVEKLDVIIDDKLQNLMIGIFAMQIKLWYKELGKIIDPIINNRILSPKLKSVLLSHFFETFSLPKESEFMQQFGFTQKQQSTKIFMEEFIREYFSIDNIFKYTTQNYRVFHRAQQLKQITFLILKSGEPIKLQDSRFVINLVMGQHCMQNINQLKQMFDFYFTTKNDQTDDFYLQFSYYYNWISAQLKNHKYLDQDGLLSSQIAFIKAPYLIEYGNIEQANEILQKAKQIFQKREKQEKVIYCDVLLIECAIKGNKYTLKKAIDKHSTEVIKKAETLGLQLKGVLYADALWRISKYFWKRIKDNNTEERNILIASFTKIAIREMSRSKGKQFINALKEKWSELSKNGMEQCQIQYNDKMVNVHWYDLGTDGCYYLTIAKWKDLKKLTLGFNKIGDKGCQYLSKGKWDHLTHLDLYENQIGHEGCKHLSRSKWSKFTELLLGYNIIGAEGCKHLSNAQWDHLAELDLYHNNIGNEGCKHLSSAKWEFIAFLNLRQNEIDAQGCIILTSAKWKHLTQLNLYYNKIGAEGCQHLKRAQWSHLTQLDLRWNRIDWIKRQQLLFSFIYHFPKLPRFWRKIG